VFKALFSFLPALFLFCATARAQAPVLVSIPPQKHMVERIAGDLVSVEVLLRPGADPHVWEPGPAQMRAAAASRIWFTIGLPFEEALVPRLADAAGGLRVVSMIRGIRRLPLPEGEDGGRERKEEDPHVWLSPRLVRAFLPETARALAELLPDKADVLGERAAAYAAELEELDAEIAGKLEGLEAGRRAFLTLHPAWRYFAMNYGLEELCLAPEGREAGPRTLQGIADEAKRHGIKCVFIEERFSGLSATAVAKALMARIVRVDPLGEDLEFVYRHMADAILECSKL
jgi:zinc transport system substrate-binding protein